MYDELVRKLRGIAEWAEGNAYVPVMRRAANAIEELTAYAQQLEKLRKEGWYLQKTKQMTYGQATMTMPLPVLPKEDEKQ